MAKQKPTTTDAPVNGPELAKDQNPDHGTPAPDPFGPFVQGFATFARNAEEAVRAAFVKLRDPKTRHEVESGIRDVVCFAAAVTQDPTVRSMCGVVTAHLDELDRLERELTKRNALAAVRAR